MSVLTSKQLSHRIKKGQIDRAYLFYGKENYLKRHYYDMLKKEILEDGPEEFNLVLLDGKTLSLQALSDAVHCLPVFARHRLVVVKDLGLSAANREIRAFFENILPSMPETSVILIYEQTTDTDEKHSKAAEIIRLFERFGAAVRFDTPKTGELLQWVGRHISERGKTADRDTISYFLSSTDNDMTHLLNEMDKLCHYARGGAITRRDIDEVVSKSVDAVIFKLTDALFERRYPDAFYILKQLISLRTEEVVIAGGIARELCNLYKARAAMDEGVSLSDMAKAFGFRDFAARRYMRVCGKISVDALRRCLAVCVETDQSLKTENRDKSLMLEAMLGEIARCLDKDKGGNGA